MTKKNSRHEHTQAQVETGSGNVDTLNQRDIDVDGWRVTVEASFADRCRLTLERRDLFTLVHIDLPPEVSGEYTIVARQPCVDIHRSWVGAIDCWRGTALTSIALNYSFDSAANCFIPVVCNFNREGVNRGVVGLLDQQPVTQVNQHVDVATPPMQWLLTRFTRTLGGQSRRETLVIAREPAHYVAVVRRFLRFCRDQQGIVPLRAPDWARKPVWCSWYSHLYSLMQRDVESQIPLLKSLGFETVLIDASWFKPPEVALNRAWGDFEPYAPLMPDMRGLSRRLHDAGLRVMLWCAPWYVGVDTACRQRMEQFCGLEDGKRSDRLCVFCDQAQAFAAQTARRLMTDFALDGIKLDFFDRIYPLCSDPEHDHGNGNFGAAIARFMAGVRDGILAANPEAAIEYRVRYSTPCTLPYANCHRGNDSPYDADYIRRENLFLRLFTDYPSATWSDYAYWHADETAENVGLMLGQQVFSGGVPTVSVNLDTCSETHRAMVRQWLSFYTEHADSLARAALLIHSADSAMSVSSLRRDRKAYVLLAGQHVPAHLELDDAVDHVWLLNSSAEARGSITIRGIEHDVSGRAPRYIDI